MTRPIRLSIHALGGQGGGVLADWIVHVAEAQGWTAQATSVPGVAQRTGATLYYLELAPPSQRPPVLAMMPTPGDVDVVIAAELMEAGRAIARGLVTPDRTVLIASTHRVFAIAEKSAMGDGVVSPSRVLDAAADAARASVLADFAAAAESHRSVISASLFGALAASGTLPFPREAFEAAIAKTGRSAERSLAAFASGFAAARGEPQSGCAAPQKHPPTRPVTPLDLPQPAQPIAALGVQRLRDYQDRSYAALYLDRLRRIADADEMLGGQQHGHALTAAAARHLALWMSYEDVPRVADLKTRRDRAMRLGEHGSRLAHVSEFMHPRFDEFCDLLPRALGSRLAGSARARRWTAPLFARGRIVTTTRLPGFLLLWLLARLRRFRRGSLRYAVEDGRIAAWLESAVNAARQDYALGVEVLRLQRLVKGYGDTHARGWRNFVTIMREVEAMLGASDAAARTRALHEAALADEDGRALHAALMPSPTMLREAA